MSLPSDIWLQIADYVSPLELEELYSVNKVFFDVAMDLKYGRISLSYLGPKIYRLLSRLREPYIARRVRVLYIHPHFAAEVLDIECNPPPSPGRYVKKMSEWTALVKSLTHKPTSRQFSFTSCTELVQTMRTVLNSLVNVMEYHIAWCGLDRVQDSPAMFLTTPLSPTLQRLHLDICLDKLYFLLRQSRASLKLEELDLFIHARNTELPFIKFLTEYGHVLEHELADFINNLKPTLRRLSIRLCHPFDISPLFRSLQYLSFLEKLTLEIPLETPHLGDPVAVSTFLNNHGSILKSLTLRVSEVSGPGLDIDTSLIREWIELAFLNVNLPHLTALDLNVSLVPFDSALSCVRRFSSTITSLVLTGAYLRFEDVEVALDAAVSLRKLRLGSVRLCPELLDMIAVKLPGLGRLELVIRDVVPNMRDMALFYREEQDEDQLEMFYDELLKRRYDRWGLSHLTLLWTRSVTPQCMHAFMQSVPSLVFFA